MITSLIFFDCHLTCRTFLWICHDPKFITWINLLITLPFIRLRTWNRLMIFNATLSAKRFSAFAFQDILKTRIRNFSKIFASLLRTPLNLLILICDLSAMPLYIFLKILFFWLFPVIQVAYKERMRDNNIASLLRTLWKDAIRPITIDLIY